MAAKKKSTTTEAPKPPPTLETLLTSPLGFRLETATPVQRAVCRAIEGRPLDDAYATTIDQSGFPVDRRVWTVTL